jgi:hypothetical protein
VELLHLNSADLNDPSANKKLHPLKKETAPFPFHKNEEGMERQATYVFSLIS